MNKLETKEAIKLTAPISTKLDSGMSVIITMDDDKAHVSIAREDRYPSWDEIRDFRYEYLPDDMTFGILLPPKKEYVNVHPNCFHLWEI